jgi:hypothetical protein
MAAPHPSGKNEEIPMRSLILGAALLFCASAIAQPLPVAAPEQAGFSKEGLARIDRFFEREIAANRVSGAVVAIARDGKLVLGPKSVALMTSDHLGLNIKNQVAAPGDIHKYYREQIDALVYGAMTELRKPK